jgi:prepilin-type N-terminal cleavage/methylation domain-containing protein
MKNGKKAFTLVELLVVISIIAMLLAILIPSLQKCRSLAQRTVCASYLKQCGIGITAYANSDSKERIPNANGYKPDYITRTIYTAIKAASRDPRVMVCPMNKNFEKVTVTGLTDPTLNRIYYMEPYPSSWNDGLGMLIGYFYLGGRDLSTWIWAAKEPDSKEWISPQKITENGSSQVMVDICHRARAGGGLETSSWTEVVHRRAGYIIYYWPSSGRVIEPMQLNAEGVNSLQLDSSVHWKGIKYTQKYPRSPPGPYRSYGWW